MPNGFTTEQVVEMIYEEVKGIHKKIDVIQSEVASVNAHGCAQRSNDIERLASLEKWKDRGVLGVISSLFLTVLAFAKAFFFTK